MRPQAEGRRLGAQFQTRQGRLRIQIPLQSTSRWVFLPIYGHNQLIIIRMYEACGRSNERPYGLDEVGIFNKSLIIIRLYDACGRSNERPHGLVRIACGLARGRHKARPLQLMWIYGLSVVGVFDDCSVVCRHTLMYIMRVYRFDDRGCSLVETSHTGSNKPPF